METLYSQLKTLSGLAGLELK